MVFDVYLCYAICGGSALAAGALTHTQGSSVIGDATRRPLWLYRLGFAGLIPLLILAFLEDAQRQAVIAPLLSLAVVATGCLAWALRELNGPRLPTLPTAASLTCLGFAVLFWAQMSGHGLTVGCSLSLALIGGLLLVDQVKQAVERKRVTSAELGLVAVLLTFLAIFAAALSYALRHPELPPPAHALHLPESVLPVAAILIALMPLAVSSLVFAVINERLLARLEGMALSDELTGALSRRGLREMGPLLIAEHVRRGKGLAVLMIDIDFFKRVNDAHGHLVGDQAIRHVSQRLRQVLRADALLARFGGEEFTVLAPIAEVADAAQLCERLRVAVAQAPCKSDAGELNITVSVGVCVFDQSGTLEQAINMADARLYQAKQAGRNQVVCG